MDKLRKIINRQQRICRGVRWPLWAGQSRATDFGQNVYRLDVRDVIYYSQNEPIEEGTVNKLRFVLRFEYFLGSVLEGYRLKNNFVDALLFFDKNNCGVCMV